nr:glutathione peroxidase [Candidatus Pantoea persica]
MSLYQTDVDTLDGEKTTLASWQGKVLLGGERRLKMRTDAAV